MKLNPLGKLLPVVLVLVVLNLFVLDIVFSYKTSNLLDYEYNPPIQTNNYLLDYRYNFTELIEKNNLTGHTQKNNYFDTNSQIKELSNLDVYEIQKWVLEFPFDEDTPKTPQNATKTLGKNKGVCYDKAVLLCSIFYEKEVPCYIISSNGKYYHSISLIYYNGSWTPILTTGVINRENIDGFTSSLFLVVSKNEIYS